MMFSLIITSLILHLSQPTSLINNDFCGRDYTLDIVDDITICGMINLDSLNDDSLLITNTTLDFADSKVSMIIKDKQVYLLMVYLNDPENMIFADIFDIDGNNVVSNHIISSTDNDKLVDIEIIIKSPIYSTEFEDIVDFMVLYRYDSEEIIKYTLCQFTGNSITNINQQQEFTPSISDDSNDLYLEFYSSHYLYKNDLYILFGSGETSSRVGVIIFNLNGDILNENQINFEIDYVGDNYHRHGISCGFNSTHDICLLNYGIDGSSSRASTGAIISIILSDANIAEITFVKDDFHIDPDGNNYDEIYNPVVSKPNYDEFFLAASGNSYGSCASCPDTTFGVIYDLYGNTIADAFLFRNDDERIWNTDCYSTDKSGIIVCENKDEMYMFNFNESLINNPGIFLNEDKISNYIKEQYPIKYSEFGDILSFTNIKLVPLTSNDFWVAFSATVTNLNFDIILAFKISVYDECCDVYTFSQNTNSPGNTDITSSSLSSSSPSALPSSASNAESNTEPVLNTPAIIGIVVGGFVLLVAVIISFIYIVCYRKKRRNTKGGGQQSAKYKTVTNTNENINDFEK